MEKTLKTRYSFAAMNTSEGFQSFFAEIFGSVPALYIIKGGPGTGKSRFMKEIGKRAEARGCSAEYFLCSSDPTSLDGVIITESDGKQFGIIDGTSPHAYEPTLAGVREHILNFGDFWDPAILDSRKKEIEALTKAKKRLYSSFYSYLSAIKAIDGITLSVSSSATDTEKLNEAVQRLIRNVPNGSGYGETVRIRGAVSCDGVTILDTYGGVAHQCYAVSDTFLTAGLFMTALKNELTAKKVAITVSYSPFSPTVPDAIYIPSTDTAFYIGCSGNEGEKTVNMRRFTVSERISPYRAKLRELGKLRKEALRLLASDGASIRALHGEIERIYGEAMDFTKNEGLVQSFSEKIFTKT